LIGQNQQVTTTETTPQVQMPFQQNSQFGFNQQQQSMHISLLFFFTDDLLFRYTS
jgi:hypothetical protein